MAQGKAAYRDHMNLFWKARKTILISTIYHQVAEPRDPEAMGLHPDQEARPDMEDAKIEKKLHQIFLPNNLKFDPK